MERLVFALESWAAATGEWRAALGFFLEILGFAAYLVLVILRLNASLKKPKLAEDPLDRLLWYITGAP